MIMLLDATETNFGSVLGQPIGQSSQQFNSVLRTHACSKKDWDLGELAAHFYGWAERFNAHFSLNLTTPAIGIERISSRTLGTYRPKTNGFGIDDEVVINRRCLQRPLADILRTLLHEMLHQWQYHHGSSGKGHHNLEFRVKCSELGIPYVCDRGSLGIVPGNPFDQLLQAHGITDGTFLSPGEAACEKAPGSKLKKWSCGCTNVRCAVELNAQCERCGSAFIRIGLIKSVC
jgi:hypothetical protein